MIAARLSERLKRLTALDLGHATLAVAASVAVALTVAAGLAVARSGPLDRADAVRRVAQATRGEWTDAALQRLTAGMDRAAYTVAARFDGGAPIEDAPGWRFGHEPALFDFRPVDGVEARKINSAIPFTADAVQAAAPFYLKARSSAERDRAVRCLANAIYYEAALEPVEGQRAVAQVVLNRLRDPNFPKSVCGVVYQGWERVTGCQFSFTCDGALVRSPVASLWGRARKVAEAALSGYVQKDVGAATHYHADYVAPYWAPGLVKIAQIGAHIFYRWPGAAGLPDALTAAYAGGELRLSEAVLSGRAARPTPPPGAIETADGAPLIKTVVVTDPVTGQSKTRVQATLTPEAYGRRAPTREEVAKINALLEERYPTKPPEPAPATPAAAAAPVAQATTSAAG